MRQLEKRAIICVAFIFILLGGTIIYLTKLVKEGSDWASYPANPHIYHQGHLTRGSIYDRNGELLLKNSTSGTQYNPDSEIAKSCLHITGDGKGNISNNIAKIKKSQLIGYNFITGTSNLIGNGRNLYLTIDSKANVIANKALAGRRGTVGIINYKTGEILCMLSSPNFNPNDQTGNSFDPNQGVYINRLTSGLIVPGSIMKTLTIYAALSENYDINTWHYNCHGYDLLALPDKKITCPYSHGNQNLKDSFANSCNCSIGQLGVKLGADTLKKYIDKVGLTTNYNIDGILTKKSRFDLSGGPYNLGWSAIGQGKDLVNPFSMLMFIGAIGGNGTVASPYILEKQTLSHGFPISLPRFNNDISLLDKDVAKKLKELMKYNVEKTYGKSNFPNLNIGAKSGTAQFAKDKRPNSWFTGFLDDNAHPYAFIALVEESGSGAEVAGNVINQVLQYLVKK